MYRDLQLLLYTLKTTDFVSLFGSCSSSANETDFGTCVIQRAYISAIEGCITTFNSSDILQ